jgi:peptide/nickel transport system permease protein
MLGEMGSLSKTLTLRTAQGVCVVGITAALALAIPRWARPDLYPDEQGWGGLAHAMRRAFFHFDFGVACGWVGCPRVSDMWVQGYAADVWMLFGAVAIGVGAGFALGLWCAGRADSRRARVVERASVLLYCTPVYVLGLGALLLFHPTFGTLPLPYFFDAAPIRASPLSSPWDWFRSLLVPWLVAAAPLAAMCLRLVVALLREQQGTDHVRTAIAKGVPHKRVIRHHAGPFARAATASLVGVSAPIVVINLILVERVFSVQGFFVHTWKATGHSGDPHQDGLPHGVPPSIDLQMLAGIAIWSSVFVVLLSFAMEFALLRLDPRLRTPRQL